MSGGHSDPEVTEPAGEKACSRRASTIGGGGTEGDGEGICMDRRTSGPLSLPPGGRCHTSDRVDEYDGRRMRKAIYLYR